MATKTITVKETAYEALKSRKKEGESFSDLIERITGGKPLTHLVEALSDEDGADVAEEIEKLRAKADSEIEERTEKIRKTAE